MATTLLFAGLYGKAQTKQQPLVKEAEASEPFFRLGVSLSPGIAFGDQTGFALGSDLRLQHSMGNHVSWILTTGYTHFFERQLNVPSPTGPVIKPISYGFIPLKAGIKIFARPKLYFAGEAGAAYSTQSTDNSYSFVYSPSAGVIIGRKWDLSLKYEDFTISNNTKQLALRVAYGFKL